MNCSDTSNVYGADTYEVQAFYTSALHTYGYANNRSMFLLETKK